MLDYQSDKDFIKTIIPRFSESTRIKLLYRLGEQDTLNMKEFHDKVDGKGATVVLMKSGVGWIAGGYTSVPWSSEGGVHKSDSEAVLFSVKHRQSYRSQKKEYAVYHNSTHGPVFN